MDPFAQMSLAPGFQLLAADWLARLIPHAAAGYADEIDHLYYLIYWIVVLTFIGVQSVLVFYLFKYRARPTKDGSIPKGKYSHGDHTLELIWTITPAVMLLFLALIQQSTWFHIKTEFPVAESKDDPNIVRVQVRAERFLWNFRYAGKDGDFDTKDDVVVPTLTVPVGKKILLSVRSKDVLHAFFLPHFRVKQDTVPGLTIPVWFEAAMTTEEYARKHDLPLVGPRAFKFDVVCAELCGNSHFNMKSTMDVLTQEQYDLWYADQQKKLSKAIQDERAAQRKELASARRYIEEPVNKFNYAQLSAERARLDALIAAELEGVAKDQLPEARKKAAAKHKMKPSREKMFLEYNRQKELVDKLENVFWGWDWPVGQKAQTTKEFQ